MDLIDSLFIENIIGDGNYLYRCFSFFVYNTQNYHHVLRAKIVSHIVNFWDQYKDFIIGDLSDTIFISHSSHYQNYMSQRGIYAGDAELTVFSEIYNVHVRVFIYNYENDYIDFDNPRTFGESNTENILILLCRGINNAGHYDVLQYKNKLFRQNFKANNIYERNQKNLLKNSSEIRIIKKRANNITNNMTEERLLKKRASDCTKNMNEERLIKKRKLEQKDNMSHARFYKKRKIDKFDIQNVTYYDFGDLNVPCKHCNALYFKAERFVNNCCHGGKVTLPQLSKYPNELKNLLYDRQFRDLIRCYNNQFAFCTFNAPNIKLDKGIYNLKIHGQVYHIMPTIVTHLKNEKPRCGQLYIYDTITSINERRKQNDKLHKNHLKILTNILENNPYAKKYKHLHELSKKSSLPEYNLYFLNNPQLNKNVYNEPRTAECAALITTKNQDISHDFDVCIFPKKGIQKDYTYLSKISIHFFFFCTGAGR